MKTKAKKFSRKLLALFLAVLMAATCFTGVMTSYAASYDTKYADDDLEYNDLAWAVLSDEQIATAVLDYADSILPALKELEPTLAKTVNNLDVPVISINYDLANRQITVKFALTTLATVKIKLGSVDELLETIQSVQGVLDGGLINTASNLGIDLGFVKDLDLSAVNGMSRSATSSTDIVRGVLGLIYDNNLKVIGDLLRGSFSTGVIGLDIYQVLGNLVGGIDAGYQSNFVYNFVQAVLFKYSGWFTDAEIAAYKADPTTFVYDDVLLEKMTDNLLNKISVLVTYPDGTSSASRRAAIDLKMAEGMSYEAAANALGYDPNLIYSEEYPGNVLLFAYGSEKIQLDKTDSLFAFGYRALNVAWKTVLKDTIKLVHVNNDVDRGHGTNFDNQFYYWSTENGTWSTEDVASNYTAAKVEAWANAVYADYQAASADEFLSWVKNNYEFDRTVAEDAVGNWRDIEEEQIFNKLRYSPLADYYFNMQTGPINLYFLQTGTANMDAFFEGYSNYTSLVGLLNDVLVAAVKDFFPGVDNVYTDAKGDTPFPTMATVNPTGAIDDAAVRSITTTLVSNTLKVIQYVADTTDKNILNGFYKANGADAVLSEANLESAMIPLLVACIGQVNLSGYKLEDMIHPEDWDKCKDAESIAFIALREYLSYVLPNKDYNVLVETTGDKFNVEFNDILIMARDAIVYVIEPYVPVTDANGDKWTAAGNTVDTTTSIFDLFNSVVCYYADNYTFTNAKRVNEHALGIASLLGACDKQGKSLITKENGTTLWNNIDTIVNEFFPVIGTLQGKGYGQADSESLIMGDIVNGVLNIGDKNATTNLCGVSNFIYRLLTIVSAEPIQTTPVTLTVYDLVKDLFNGLLGPRYDGQSWVPVPDRTSDHPWDDVLQASAVAGASASEPGVLGKAINNFVEFSGFGYNNIGTYPDSIIPGLMFAVTAVNSFIEILPSINGHQLKLATAEFKNPTFTGCASGNNYNSSVTITNNSIGVNAAYVDGINKEVDTLSRYYMRVKSATISGSSNAATISTPSSALLAPGESITVSTVSPFAPTNNASDYTVTFTYDICNSVGSVLYSDLTASAYQFLTGEVSWESVVYPADRIHTDGTHHLNLSLETDKAGETKTVNGYSAVGTNKFASNLVATVPSQIVLGSDNLSAVDAYGLRVKNTSGLFGSAKSVDGVYYYEDATVYNDGSASNVTVNSNNPIPVFDKTTGDIIKYELFDISYDKGATWDRNGTAGFTQDEINTKLEAASKDAAIDVNDIQTRDHVVYTFAEAQANGNIAAYHINEKTDQYEYIYLKSGSVAFDTLLGQISVRGPVEGFYLNSSKQTVDKNGGWAYFRFLKYDGKTEVSSTDVTSKVAFYNGGGSGYATINFIICDTSSAAAVKDNYETLQSLMAQYKVEDFVDGQTVYNEAHDAIVSALSATALPLTPDTAKALTDTTKLDYTTSVAASKTGDKAYRPLTTDEFNALTNEVKKIVYYNSDNDCYYLDAKFSRPAYSTVALTAADITDGKDKYGMPVTAVTVDGETTYYYTNTAEMETEWDTTTFTDFPYRKDTATQATDGNGNLLYNQVQFSYFNAKGEQISSTGNWVVKAADSSYQLVPITSTTDTRGIYTKNNDRLQYTIEYVKDHIDPTISQTLLDDVSMVRNGLNETNFEIVTYNIMVKMAKFIEGMYTIDVTYDRVENKVDELGNVVLGQDGFPEKVTNTYTEEGIGFNAYSSLISDKNVTITAKAVNSSLSSTQIAEYKRLFNIYMGAVVERGYLGDQLQAEIPCASGADYSQYAVTGVTVDDKGNNDYSAAVVNKSGSEGTILFGSTNANGDIVNNGDVVYPTALWSRYIETLARAIDMAQLGNTTYAHKAPALFNAYATDYDARVTDVYSAKLDLQAAEIALENTTVLTVAAADGGSVTVDGEAYAKPMALVTDSSVEVAATAAEGYEFKGFTVDGSTELVTDNPMTVTMDKAKTVTPVFESTASSGVTVSGTVMVATDLTGTAYTGGVVGINILANGEVIGTSAADGTFTVTVPAGVTELTFQGESTVDRTVTISGTADVSGAIVPIVICDYNKDLKFNSNDSFTFSKAFAEYNVYADLTADGKVNSNDTFVFSKFLGNIVTYDSLNLG